MTEGVRAPRIAVLTGGVGGSKFVIGLRDALRQQYGDAAGGALTAVVNTGDDLWLHGLRIQPDVDSVIYGLAGVRDVERGWGRADEREVVAEELRAFGAGSPWFSLGDRDLGAHIARSAWLREGAAVHEVVERLAARWELGARVLPMTDAEVDTIVSVDDGGAERSMHFQEWWTRYRARLPARSFRNPGAEEARPAPGVLSAIAHADAVCIAPSNPVVSIAPILSIPGIRDAVRRTSAPVVGVSPIIGGRVVRGMADACLAAIGVETSAEAVALHYGARSAGGLLDAFLIGDEDRASVAAIARGGITAHVGSIWMRDESEGAALAGAAIAVARAVWARE